VNRPAGMYKVHGDEDLDPELALLSVHVKRFPSSTPNIKCRSVDLRWQTVSKSRVPLLCAEPAIAAVSTSGVSKRFSMEQYFESVHLPAATDRSAPVVFTDHGGMGGIGLTAGAVISLRSRAARSGSTQSYSASARVAVVVDTHPADDRMSGVSESFEIWKDSAAEVCHL